MWEQPLPPVGSPPSNDHGWEVREDPKGRQFFVDHNLRRTTYQDPRQAQVIPTSHHTSYPIAHPASHPTSYPIAQPASHSASYHSGYQSQPADYPSVYPGSHPYGVTPAHPWQNIHPQTAQASAYTSAQPTRGHYHSAPGISHQTPSTAYPQSASTPKGNSTTICPLLHSSTEVNQEKKELARQAFQMYDRDQSGKISRHEFYMALTFLGTAISAENSNVVFDIIDSDRNNFITFDEFAEYYVANF
eukprot:gene9920-2103_t